MRASRDATRVVGRACAAACMLAAACAHAPEGPVVESLRIEGNHEVSSCAIVKVLATQPHWADLCGSASSPTGYLFAPVAPWTPAMPWTELSAFDEDVYAGDLERLARFYRRRGFFSAKVTAKPAQQIVDAKGRARIRIAVEEGPPALISAVRIDGLDAMPETQRRAVLGRVAIREGARFDEDDYDDTKEAMNAELRNQGYLEAQVRGRVEVDPAAARAAVALNVEPGPRYKVETVIVGGAESISRARILNKSALKEGEWYSTDALFQTQEQIYGMGVFAGVTVRPAALDRAAALVPIAIKVSEAPLSSLRFGGGLGLESNQFRLRGRFEYVHRNFFPAVTGRPNIGQLSRLEFTVHPGWAFIFQTGTLSSLQALFQGTPVYPVKNGLVGDAALQLTLPDVGLMGLFDLAFRADYERAIQESFDYDRAGLRIAAPIPRRNWVVTPSLNGTLFFNVRDLVNASADLACRSNCAVGYLELRGSYDGRDNALDASSGLYASLALAAGVLGGEAAAGFGRIEPEARAFFSPFGRAFTLAARAAGGAFFPFGNPGVDTPPLLRFFAGGANSVRGFGSRSLGLLELSGDCAPEVGKPLPASCRVRPVGGNWYYEGTVEARLRFGESMGVVAFLDAGDVEGGSSFPEIVAGAGLRYVLASFAPIRADLGFRLTPQPNRCLDSLGVAGPCPAGVDDVFPPSFFLSLGQAF